MHREADLIDVWFDSGAMPYAQLHYPFENKELIDERKAFPADYIAEGVDQTRGWFFTLHAIGVLCFDSIAFKNVISNGLVLDKDGNKMSKRLGNATDPFTTLATYGPDATRWYMLGNAQPWDNLKFNVEGISEVQRKFFGTLYNTYAFFALYANIDEYRATGKTVIPVEDRPELDQWILSRLNSLIKFCTERLDDYDPTPVVRAIEDFVSEQLSNWYVRLSRRRFWKSESSSDKQAAYETLNECLSVISRLISPVAPFFGEFLFRSLHQQGFSETESNPDSVHLSNWPVCKSEFIQTELEERMELAQKLTSMVLGLRKKVNIRVRQPLERMLVPALDAHIKLQLEHVKELILSETNVKSLEFIDGNNELIQKRVKANFKSLGKKAGGKMKQIAELIVSFSNKELDILQRDGQFPLFLDKENPSEAFQLSLDDVEIYTEDIPGWLVMNDGAISVALDISISENLKEEGLARELVNKIQNLRKNSGFEVTDRIDIIVKNHPLLTAAVENNKRYICAETLGESLTIFNDGALSGGVLVELTEEISTEITIAKLN
jgi:isoleucyl-tRNA synthetase